MNILILNWRDIKNPKSGGAEILTHEIAKRFVRRGHKVTQFSSCFPNCLAEEEIDGVKIIRRGHSDARYFFRSVHFLAFWHYLKNFRGKFDVVIDEVHGLPFFTPWYVKEKKIVLICEVADELWIKMFGPFLGLFGRLTERIYLRFIYKNIPYLTISNSTKEELIREGVESKNITVLPMGLTIPKKMKKVEKEKDPTLIFVGRLSKSKGIEDAIEALRQISKIYPKTKFWIVGGGDKNYIGYLKKIAKKLDASNRITFWEFVSEEKKFELMGRAHLLLTPSMKEGWGLIVPEAARVQTPSVVYDVPGLRDIIVNGVNGIMVKKNTPLEIGKEVIRVLKDKDLYAKLQLNARKTSLTYNWNNTAETVFKILKNETN